MLNGTDNQPFEIYNPTIEQLDDFRQVNHDHEAVPYIIKAAILHLYGEGGYPVIQMATGAFAWNTLYYHCEAAIEGDNVHLTAWPISEDGLIAGYNMPPSVDKLLTLVKNVGRYSNRATIIAETVHGEVLTVAEASRRYGIAKDTLRNRMSNMGLTLEEAADMGPPVGRGGHKPFEAPVHGEMLTIAKAAKQYGININTLVNRMKRNGLTLEEAVDFGAKLPPGEYIQKSTAETVHGKAMTIAEASKRFGINYKTLFSRVRYNGKTLEQAVDMGSGAKYCARDEYKTLVHGENMSIAEASTRYGIPQATLRHRMRFVGRTLEEAVDMGPKKQSRHGLE